MANTEAFGGRVPVLPLAAVLSLILFTGSAEHIDSRMAEKVILGEAADQGLEGMIAVAEVIRNRGSLKGFSSMRKDLDRFAAQQPAKARREAQKAWRLSRHTNYTRGATHFDNVRAFGKPRWAKDMVTTAVIADMHYFREKRRR